MKSTRPLILAAVLSIFAAAPAAADITAFLGANTTPANRQTRGVAVGVGFLIVAFEFEYAFTPDDPTATAPSLRTGSANVLLQSPIAFMGVQPYFTTGGGLFRETLGTHQETNFALNSGGGVKVALAGPIRLRIDYRVSKLGDGALSSPAHRVYAGLNLKF